MRRIPSVPRVVAVTGAALALAGSAFAANEIAGRDRPPAAATVTIDSTAPLFTEAGLVNGQTFDRCTVLTNEGPQPADVTLFGTASQADLSPWLHLELIRGTLPAGTATGDCTGFAADAADWGDGTPGVIYRGTLADLPDTSTGIADPTRWAVGEQHAYLLRVHYTGDDPQQGLSTTQSFSWGATPFDDRGPDPFQDPGTPIPGGTTGPTGSSASTTPIGTTPPKSIVATRQCTVVSFPTRSYIGARAISRVTKVKKAKATTKAASAKTAKRQSTTGELGALTSSSTTVVSSGEDPSTLTPGQVSHRKKLLAETGHLNARRSPVVAVRLAPTKGGWLSIRVGLRKNGVVTSPHRWKWVRIRLNSTATISTLRWPFTAKAKMDQIKTGYNQLDLTLARGRKADRVRGLPSLLRRSFAFVVGVPTASGSGSDCTLG